MWFQKTLLSANLRSLNFYLILFILLRFTLLPATNWTGHNYQHLELVQSEVGSLYLPIKRNINEMAQEWEMWNREDSMRFRLWCLKGFAIGVKCGLKKLLSCFLRPSLQANESVPLCSLIGLFHRACLIGAKRYISTTGGQVFSAINGARSHHHMSPARLFLAQRVPSPLAKYTLGQQEMLNGL